MTEIAQEASKKKIASILNNYGFEMRGYTPHELMERWLKSYPLKWIEIAVVEALYQGRYKVISIEEILKIWLRKGQPTFHFTYEFERLVYQKPDLFNKEDSRSVVQKRPPDERSSLFESPKQVMTDIEKLFSQIPLPVANNIALSKASGESEKKLIPQFTPLLDGSVLYSKLKAIARQ